MSDIEGKTQVEQVNEYLAAIRKKFDLVEEHPEEFWDVMVAIAEKGEQLPDVAMLATKDEYRKEVGKLMLSIAKALGATLKKIRAQQG